jgi:hypothetical protein
VVVWQVVMSARDDEVLAAAVAATVETVPIPEHPIPDHRASEERSTATDEPVSPAPERKRRRLIGGATNKPEAGSRDAASKGMRAIPAGKEKKPLPPIPPGGFAPAVEKMYGTIALAVMPLDMELAAAIMQVAPDAAAAWDELARRNHAVRRILVAMMQTTAAGALFAAHMPIILLFVQRAMGDNPRVSMLAGLLGAEAEAHANGEAA